MKALSIRQPWAWLIVNGYKDIENRSWPTKVRGRVYIHSGKRKVTKNEYEEYKMLCQARGIKKFPAIDEFKTKGIIGSAKIVDCVERSNSPWYQKGNYGFVLSKARKVKCRPIKGKLGFFEVKELKMNLKRTMTAKELWRAINKLPETEKETTRLEKCIQLRTPGRPAWYRTQKEHWLGWLKEYNGPGAYGRSNWKRDAAYIYNHIQYAPMLIWLGESLGISKVQLKKASNSALKAGKNYARQCAAVRAVIPWSQIESAIRKR